MRCMQVTAPTETAVRLQEEIENLTRILSKMSRDLTKVQGEKEELKSMNIVSHITSLTPF